MLLVLGPTREDQGLRQAQGRKSGSGEGRGADLGAAWDQEVIPNADCASGMESSHLLGLVGVTLGPHFYKGLRKSLVEGPLIRGP